MSLERINAAIDGIMAELEKVLAEVISEIEDDAERAEMAERYADQIAVAHPDFDRAVFMSACGVTA